MKIQALLATAPFGPLNMPSIGLTLLKGFAHAHNFCAEINYVNMDFAKKVGVGFYNLISVGYPENTNLAGDFLFSTFFHQKTHNEIETFIFDRLFGDQTDDRRSPFAKKFGDFAFHLSFIEQYRHAIAQVPSWVESTAKYLAERNAGIYGFTSMFQQNLASLALARRLKQLRPGCLILLGGPNCEHPMSEALLAEFPFIDMVCSGEGEEAFVSVLQFNESGCTTRLHPNLRTRSIPNSVAGRKPSPLQITNIESLAVPDYDDYFSQLSSVLGSQDVHPRVLLETSRGCWWGEKAHCTFCGLNGASMAFRSKSAEKALSEITTLRDKHPEAPISVVDNIMDYRYFKTLLPMLAKENIDIELFYETKANLTKDQLKAMRAAGISRIQPGIESLSSPVLRLMRKGVKAIQNVCLLKWCFEESVRPEWNFLWGFPDEDPAEYHSMASLVPHLRHLTPPLYASSIRLERFSPLYEHRDKEAIVHVRPYGAYGDVYDVSESRLGELAYYFEFEYLKHPEISSYTKDLHAEIEQWNLDHPHCYLIYSLTSTGTLVFDGREPGNRKILKFSPASQHIFQVTENPISIKALIAGLPENEDAEFHQTLVQDLIRQGILVFIDGLLFNIAVELSAAQTYPNFAYSAFINDLNRLDTKSFTLPGIRRMVTGIPSCTSRSNIAFQALKKVVTVHPPPWKGEGQGQCR